MTVLNNDKIQVIQEAIDSEKLLKCIQDMPEDRVEKAFQNDDIKKLADRLSEDAELFDAVMNVYDTDKSYEAATARVPGKYTKAEFDEFRTVYANLFLKDFHDKIFLKKDPNKLTDEELDQVAGGASLASVWGFVGKGVNFVVDKIPMSEDAKKVRIFTNKYMGVTYILEFDAQYSYMSEELWLNRRKNHEKEKSQAGNKTGSLYSRRFAYIGMLWGKCACLCGRTAQLL